MKKVVVSARVLAYASLLTAGSAALLLSQCRTFSDKSVVREAGGGSAGDMPTQTFQLLRTDKPGTFTVQIPDAGRGFKAGDKLTAQFGVVQKRAGNPITCDKLPGKQSVTLKAAGKNLAFDLPLKADAFKVCTNADKTRKLSLACQNSGDWDGPKSLELCLRGASADADLRGRAVPVSPKAAGFGLAATALVHTDDVVNYGKVCAERLGALPRDWSCLDGQIIPITKDGVEIPFDQHQVGQTCDKPAYLGLGTQGQCIPYARLGRLKTAPDVETVFICRRYNIFKPQQDANGNTVNDAQGNPVPGTERYAIEENAFQDVAIVQHNVKTGESCFYQALAGFRGYKDLPTARIPPPNEESVPDDIKDKYTKATLADGAPNPTYVAETFWPEPATGFWITPSSPNPTDTPGQGFECTACHDSDAYMHSPYVDQLNYTYPDDHPLAGQTDKMVPCDPGSKDKLSAPECIMTRKGLGRGKVSLVHDVHRRWLKAFNIAPKGDNTCVRCHRIGSIATCGFWAQDSVGGNTVMADSRTAWSKTFPENHWMPIGKEFFKEWNQRSCKPNLADPAHPVDCPLDEAQWRQAFKEGADKTLACCNLAQTAPFFPADKAKFDAACTSEPITEDPPVTSGKDSITLTSSTVPVTIADFDQQAGKPGVTTINLASGAKANGAIRHVQATLRLDHDKHTQLVIRLKNADKQATIYDGQEDGYPGASGELNINFNSADNEERFKSLLGSDGESENWQLIIEDRKAFETGALTAVEVVVGLN